MAERAVSSGLQRIYFPGRLSAQSYKLYQLSLLHIAQGSFKVFVVLLFAV